MVNITPRVGRHTWANITLEFIYNSLLSESLILAQDYGIRARMNGVLEPAIEQLRAVADDAGILNHPLLKELVRRKEHVNQVMARIEMAKAGGLFNR